MDRQVFGWVRRIEIVLQQQAAMGQQLRHCFLLEVGGTGDAVQSRLAAASVADVAVTVADTEADAVAAAVADTEADADAVAAAVADTEADAVDVAAAAAAVAAVVVAVVAWTV